MALFESAHFCSIDEYVDGEPHRLQVEEYVVDEFYMMFFALHSVDPSTRAAKHAVSIDSIEENAGVHKVGFSLLNEDLQRYLTLSGIFDDGIYRCAGGLTLGGVTVRTGYLRQYDDGIGFDPHLFMDIGAETLAVPPENVEDLRLVPAGV